MGLIAAIWTSTALPAFRFPAPGMGLQLRLSAAERRQAAQHQQLAECQIETRPGVEVTEAELGQQPWHDAAKVLGQTGEAPADKRPVERLLDHSTSLKTLVLHARRLSRQGRRNVPRSANTSLMTATPFRVLGKPRNGAH